MKSVKFLLGIFTLVVVMTSCATTQGAYDDTEYGDNTRRVGNRVYVDDPYYGQVVLERDPISGRYYDVTNGYRGYGAPYNGYNRYRGTYRNYPVYRNNNNNVNVPRPVPNQRPQVTEQTRQEAREKILGKKN